MEDRINYIERKAVRLVIINEDNHKVLLFGDGLVGGGVEEGESEEEALHRECLEETGVTVEIVKYLGEVATFSDKTQKKYIARGYLCKQIGVSSKPTTTIEYEQSMVSRWVDIQSAIQLLENRIKNLPVNPTTEEEINISENNTFYESLEFIKLATREV